MTKDFTSRKGKLLKDTIIYSIGSIGSRLIMVLMLPLYTHFLSKEDLGFYDMWMTIILFATTLTILDLREGAFRFLLYLPTERNFRLVISNSFFVVFVNCGLVAILSLLFNWMFPVKYFGYLLLVLLSYSVFDVQTQALRGIGQTKVFIIVNLLVAFILCSLSFVLVKYFQLGLEAFFLSYILGRVSAIAYIEWKTSFFRKYYSSKLVFKRQIFKMLRYTLPLIPGVGCWWLISSSGKLIISHYLGFQSNGIFAISLKFSDMLFIISSIFYQSWQETAIREYNSRDRDYFFSSIFNRYFLLLSIVLIVSCLIIKAFFNEFIGTSYEESLLYIYPLMISVIFLAMSSFLDLGYQCSLQSAKSLPSIISATILNLILNYLMICPWGLNGIAFASVITYLYLFIYRILHTRRFFNIKINYMVYFSVLSLVVGGGIFYGIENRGVLLLSATVYIFLGAYFFRHELFALYDRFRGIVNLN